MVLRSFSCFVFDKLRDEFFFFRVFHHLGRWDTLLAIGVTPSCGLSPPGICCWYTQHTTPEQPLLPYPTDTLTARALRPISRYTTLSQSKVGSPCNLANSSTLKSPLMSSVRTPGKVWTNTSRPAPSTFAVTFGLTLMLGLWFWLALPALTLGF